MAFRLLNQFINILQKHKQRGETIMKKMKRFMSVVVIAGALMLAGCGNGGSAEGADGKVTIKVAHYFAETHPQNVALNEKFKKMVEEETEGRVTVELYPANQLGDEEQFTNGVRNGTVEMAVTGMGLQTANPKIGAVEWPFLFKNYAEAKTALNGEVGDDIETEFKSLGVEPLAWTANGFRVVSSNRAIESMEDFGGLRLRMPNIDIFVNTGEALGVSVQPMPLSEVFTALEQQVIDGQENPYPTLKESGFYEVQSHVLESRHMFSPNVYLMNSEFFESLDEETQKIIQKAAQASADYEWQLVEEAEAKVKEDLKTEGLTIIEPDDAFKQEMVDAMKPVYDDLYEKYEWAEDFMNKVEASKE
jgi:tripartite ATP-independent transporter DctP family solute receptor